MVLYQDKQKVLFASELNALKALLPLEINEQHISRYLRLGYFFKNETPYKNTTEVPPGSFVKIDINNLNIQSKKWWDIQDYYSLPVSDNLDQSISKVNELLQIAVKRRVEASDLEVGSFLSGGIDSGLITAIASGITPKLKTFTVSFEGEYDEAPLARLVAKKYNTEHNELRISFDHLKNDLEKILLRHENQKV